MNKLEKAVYDILRKPPIDIIDDIEYSTVVLSSDRWILSSPRKESSSRIGLFNIWLALKEISQHTNRSFSDEKNIDTLATICDNLTSAKLLKASPNYNRNQFTLITNEEYNGERKERDSND